MLSPDPLLNYGPKKTQHIHIMGICGTGMAALAGMLQSADYTVTGSDNHVYPPMSDFLEKLQIPVAKGYTPDNLQPLPDLVIVGNVIPKKNPEAQAMVNLGLPYLSFPQALAHFFIQSKTSLVVAGTHGKTTTCSLLASCLHKAELDPSFMIGGIVKEFDANFRLGQGDFFVAEGDEYDTAFFDKESKFLHYIPKIAILTSIEFDHADIFEDLQQIKDAFIKFVRLLPKDGLLIANFDDDNVKEIAANAICNVQSYGLSPAYDWSISDIRASALNTDFNISKNGQAWGTMKVGLPGTHNCLNSLAVSAVMSHLGVSPETTNIGLKSFSGVKRRQEVRGVVDSITVIDDFAHHPTAVEETLNALKNAYDGQRLVVVFEPRTNSSRRSIFQQDYAKVFGAADIAILKEPIPIAGLQESEMFSCARLASDITENSGVPAEAYRETDDILNRLSYLLKKEDVVAVLSNGGFDNIHNRLIEQLKNNCHKQP